MTPREQMTPKEQKSEDKFPRTNVWGTKVMDPKWGYIARLLRINKAQFVVN